MEGKTCSIFEFGIILLHSLEKKKTLVQVTPLGIFPIQLNKQSWGTMA
jgi:hypothetical protein